MKDLTDITISAEATAIARSIAERYCFSSVTKVLSFALSLSLRDYIDNIDYDTLDTQYKTDGTNLTAANIDNSDSLLKRIITMRVSGCETPNRYARVAIIYGLYKIDEMMKSNPSFQITDIM